jgi:hypothetical protein
MDMKRMAGAALAVVAGGLVGCGNTGVDAAKLEALTKQVETLQHEVDLSHAWTDVANLQAAYGYYVDKMRWDEAADLFAKDGTLEIAGRGLFTGQERVRAYLKQLGDLSRGKLYNHMQLQPVIHVAADGLSAKARWRSLMQVGELGKEARWGEATYENTYVKEGGVWKIASLHSFITFYVDFDKGWNKGAVPMPKEIPGLQPDKPSTVAYGSFPDVFVPPYHYVNPVTGK